MSVCIGLTSQFMEIQYKQVLQIGAQLLLCVFVQATLETRGRSQRASALVGGCKHRAKLGVFGISSFVY